MRHCSIGLHFSNNWWCSALFVCLLAICILNISLEKCLDLLPIFGLGYLFFFFWAACAICIFWRLIPCRSHLDWVLWLLQFSSLPFRNITCFQFSSYLSINPLINSSFWFLLFHPDSEYQGTCLLIFSYINSKWWFHLISWVQISCMCQWLKICINLVQTPLLNSSPNFYSQLLT